MGGINTPTALTTTAFLGKEHVTAAAHQKPINPRFQDLTGRTFGRLTVVAYAGKTSVQQWLCRCECGEEKVVGGSNLKRGKAKSCGCLNAELASARRKTHGMTRTAIYRVWAGMIQRCTDHNCSCFARYGGRGITVCHRWRESFEAFLEDMGPRPSRNHSLDRHPNNEGNYEPGNVRWATSIEQARNKRSNRLLTHDGRTASVAEWVGITGLAQGTIMDRLRRGWPHDKVLTTPLLVNQYG